VIKKSHLPYVACLALSVAAVLFPPYRGVIWSSAGPRHFFEGWHFVSFGFFQLNLGTSYCVHWPLLIAEMVGILAVAICVAVLTRRRTAEPQRPAESSSDDDAVEER